MTRTRLITAAAAATLLLASPAYASPNYARIFAGRDGCFELYDLKTNKLVTRYNPSICGKRVSPASTFKVPLSLMAFDAGLLKDENSAMKWDGKKTRRPEWNQDQTAASWMRLSVVWFSQRLTPRLGMQRIKTYLARFRYGNQDMSGGITKAWLQSSLLISPDEQLRFWEHFWREELPVSKHAFDMTKKITLLGTSRSGWTVHGKTGSAAMVADGKLLRGSGWFVGHIARGNREYVFVTHYSDRAQPTDRRPPGWIAREITTSILKANGLY
jgi:beta-lactamase class D